VQKLLKYYHHLTSRPHTTHTANDNHCHRRVTTFMQILFTHFRLGKAILQEWQNLRTNTFFKSINQSWTIRVA